MRLLLGTTPMKEGSQLSVLQVRPQRQQTWSGGDPPAAALRGNVEQPETYRWFLASLG